MRGRNVGDLGCGGRRSGGRRNGRRVGGWLSGFFLRQQRRNNCSFVAAAEAAFLLLLSLSLLTPSSSFGSSRCHDESETKCRLISCTFETSLLFFFFSSVAVALLLCYVHALLFSLIFVAHDGSVASSSSSSPWSFGPSFRAAGQEGGEQEVFKRPRNARAGRGIVVSGDRRWRWRILNPRRNKSWRRYPTMWRSRLTSPMVCSLCMAISGISSEAS